MARYNPCQFGHDYISECSGVMVCARCGSQTHPRGWETRRGPRAKESGDAPSEATERDIARDDFRDDPWGDERGTVRTRI